MDRVINTQPCGKCKTARGIAFCGGCHELFCKRHFDQHRQELSLQMDALGQNYDLFKRDLSEEPQEHPLVARINSWEQESIEKIQKAAATARNDLRQLLDRIKSDLQSSVVTTVTEIKDFRHDGGYTENELNRWTIELDKFRQEFEAPCQVSIKNDTANETSIDLIKLSVPNQPFVSPLTEPNDETQPACPPVEKRSFFLHEKFDSKTDATLSANQLIATCVPKYGSPGAIVNGVNMYTTGTYDISFRIEKKGLSRLFFGIYSAAKKCPDAISSGDENSVYGWWDMNSSVSNGIRQESGAEQMISTNDKLVLTIDCEHQQIQFYHIRKNQQTELPVDINKCPFPWKMIVKLTANHDSVRIL